MPKFGGLKKNNMTILVFSWRDPKHPLAGGAEQVMHEHMKGWIKTGHSVTLFSSHFNGAPRREVADGVEIIRYSYQYLGVHLAAFFWYLFGQHPKFDLVVDHFHGVPFFTPLYVRIRKLAVLQETAREVWLINQLPKPFNWIVGWIGYLLEPFFFTFYKEVTFMVGSNSAKLDLVNFGIPADNITIVPHGVLVKKPVPMPKKERKKTVIFLGALARDKGIEDAIKTFGILNRQDDFKFWVVGKGPPSYVAFLEQMAKGVGRKKKVKFWGFVSQGRKFELLARAHVMVNPSIREGWGLVNIEANAMGTPVVAYRSAGLVDSVKNNQSGILCNQDSPQELAKITLNVLCNKNLYKKLSEGAIAWSNTFSWEKSRKKSLELIEKIAYHCSS